MLQLQLQQHALIVGDFNTRHPLWDPFGTDNSLRARELVEWIEANNLYIHNHPNTGTFYRVHIDRPSVLDLTLSRGIPAGDNLNWHTLDSGSDHLAISLKLPQRGQGLYPILDERQRYNLAKADWDRFQQELQPLQQSLDGIEELDELADLFSKGIKRACDRAIPRTRMSPRSKPWWTPQLRELRRQMAREQRGLYTSPSLLQPTEKQAYLIARNRYFLAIKNAKRDH